MDLYKGKFTLDIITIAKTNDGKDTKDQAHESIPAELLNEVMALLGAKGYITQSYDAAWDNKEVAYDIEVEQFEKAKLEAMRRARLVYSKENRNSVDFD